ncbi:exoskeleton protein RP43-like [Penaeus monodon]|uniref:exoskeleton protein RP43-like n=1 Tax=Penaeus monodon TaxID=6687 RepID=UPI0018A7C12F|nr:exoskeleton protein RP43-like [Penaeus monodon]
MGVIHTNDSWILRMFRAVWITLRSVTSSNYYVDNQSIEWRIEVTEGKRVRLTWQSFELEIYDTAEVADPCTGLPYSWSTYTGTELPPPFTASGKELIIRFTTDVSVILPGFSLSYEAV